MNWPPPFPNPHPPGCFWHDWAVQFGSPDLRICEQVTCSVFSTPINTWSNLAYLLVGLYLWNRDSKFSILIITLGLISFLAHASNIYPTLILDIGATFSLIGWCFGKNLIRMQKLSEKKLIGFVLFISSIGMLSAHILLVQGMKFAAIVPIGATFVVVTEYLSPAPHRKWFIYALLTLMGGFFFSAIDIYKHFCNPSHWFQGHAFWHGFTALTAPFIERHYRASASKL